MDPDKRSMLQVTIKNAFEATEMFTHLMGSDVTARRIFINDNAKFVKNLDI